MKPPRYLASLALLVMVSACETTRNNTQQEKTRTRNIICNVPDRCGITP